jgi:hypothetical protein
LKSQVRLNLQEASVTVQSSHRLMLQLQRQRLQL